MRITYLYAENMQGIKVGTGLDKIEINFEGSESNIFNLLIGNNGSGKTSILSLLHPFRDTFDGRTPVREGIKAYKEIHITDNENLYVIKHTWKPNKSYILKNNEELNESGSIKLFNQIVKDELGIDGEYFKIARIGSNVTNFIEYTSGMRKTYIGNFLPYIDDYLQAYEISKKKYSTLNKDLSNIGNQLDKFRDIDTIRELVDTIDKNIKTLEDNIDKYKSKKIKLESKLDNLKVLFKSENNIDFDDIDDILDEYDEICNSNKVLLNKYKKKRKQISDKYNIEEDELKKHKNLLSFIKDEDESQEEIQREINTLDTKIQILNSKVDLLNKELEIYYNMDSLNYEGEISKIEDIINSEKEFIGNLNEELNDGTDYSFLIDELNFDNKSFSDIHLRYNLLCDNILSLLKLFNINSEIDYDILNNSVDLKKKLTILEKEYEDVSNELSYIDKNSNLINILKKRPSSCVDDSCKFIRNALDYKINHYDKRNKYENKLSRLHTEIEDIESKIVIYDKTYNFDITLKDIHKKLLALLKKYNPNEDIFKKDTISKENLFKFLKRDINFISEVFNLSEEFLYISKYYVIKDKKLNLKNNIDKLNSLKKDKEKEDKLLERYKDYKDERNKLMEEIKELSNSMEEEEDNLQESCAFKGELNELLNILDELKSVKDRKKELSLIINDYDKCKSEIEEKENFILDIEEELKNNRFELTRQKKEYDNNYKDLTYVEVLLNNKKELDDKFKKTKLIKDALDPKKGIPLLFIDKFLKKIEVKTNELLELAYGSEFRIKFDITDKDFFIKVLKTFNELPDINLASQGEVSLTTVSLSLTMIQYMVKKYNILYLDEIDGALSNKNRRIFLSMLEKQIEELGLEQIFIITHNKEFYSYPINLIVLKYDETDFDLNDEELTENKNIVFSLDNYKPTVDDNLKVLKKKKKGKDNNE